MKIKLQHGKSASNKDIFALEAKLGCRISDSFKNFLKTQDGAVPENNVFKISETNASGVNRFISVSKIPKERQYIDNIPMKAYPIAFDACGNYIIIDERNDGAVFFWDHEIPEGFTKLASSFAEFIVNLEPFDLESIHLEPDQIEEVWIDPDFLKKLKGRS